MTQSIEANRIDDLLRQDEEELKAKKKSLKGFATSLDQLRAAVESTRESARVLLDAGYVSRTDAIKIFELSGPEKSLIFPRSTSSAKPVDESAAELHAAAYEAADAPSYPAQQ